MVQPYDKPLRRSASLTALGLLLFFCSGCRSGPESQPNLQARDGRLDLSRFDFNEKRVLSLSGEWLSYASHDSAAFADYTYDDAAWRPADVERYFTTQGYPPEGLVWYRLHLRLPPDAPPLKGYLQHANNAHALFAATSDGRVVDLGASGTPASTAEATVRSRAPVLFTLPADTALVLSWKIANFDYLNGGPFYAVQLGSDSAIDRMLLRRLGLVFSSFGLYMLIAFAFGLYGFFHRRSLRAFTLSALALVMAVRTVTMAGALEHLFPTAIGFEARITLEAFTTLFLLALFPLLLWSFFPLEFAPFSLGKLRIALPEATRLPISRADVPAKPPLPLPVRLANTSLGFFSVLVGMLFSLIVLLAPPFITSHVLAVARWIMLGLLGLAMVITFEAFNRRRPLSLSMVLGFALLVTLGAHDIFLAQGLISGHMYLGTYAFLGFVLIQSYAVARSFLRELHTATAAAQAANKAKSQFLSAVSHEIRTPLTAVIGYSQILEEDLDGRLDEQERDFLRTIRASGNRMLHLADDLLDLARAEEGKLDLSLKAIQAASVVSDVVTQMHGAAVEKNLSIAFVPPKENLWVYADALRLHQVLANLLSNAIKFTRHGGVTLTLEPGTQLGLEGLPVHVVHFTVEDTGQGISSKFMNRLFDRFTQEARLYDETQRGTGLGLALTYELVRRMDGAIKVDSKVGVGSTFTVTLPRAEAPLEPDVRLDEATPGA